MKKSIFLFLIVLFAFGNSFAQKGFKDGSAGMKYKIISKKKNKSGRQCKSDDVVYLKLKYTNHKDSLIFNSEDNASLVSFKVGPSAFKGDLNEGLLKMKEGDSAQFLINADSLFEKVFNQALPTGIDKGSKLHFFVKLQKVSTEAELLEEQKVIEAKANEAEAKNIDLYIKENNFNALKTESGLRIIILNPCLGTQPQKGNKVKVHYTGKLLDGTKFDSSVDKNEPFQFTLGVGQVIKGWDEGIALLKKGEKGLLIIPSYLGYGSRGAGHVIKPYSSLVFEVELLDFEQ